ncbi:MAG: extracellular solute-binding protein [Phycisphaerae bacterium]|nr:extracellular solute-binding protein [Phycisphaerae bacterium]
MKYLFAIILTLLVVWSLLAWQITPETRARQHVVSLDLAKAEGWQNLPQTDPPALAAEITTLCNMPLTGASASDRLHLLLLPTRRAYDRAILCRGRDANAIITEARVSKTRWTDPFELTTKPPHGPVTMSWRMNLRELSPDGARILLYLSHVFDDQDQRPLQQAMYLGLDKPDDWRVSLYRVTDPHPQRRFELEAFNRWFPECYIRLDTVDTATGGVQKLIVQTCSGVGPSIIDVYGVHQLQMYVSAGILRDVTDDAKRLGFGPELTYPKAAKAMFIDGRQYCFPCNVNVRVLIYNKNLFDRYDVPYPPTDRVIDWLEFVQKYGKPLTVRSPGRSVPDCFGLTLYGWEQMLYQAGGDIYSPDGTRSVLDSPEAIAGLQMYQDLMHRFNVMPNPIQQAGMSGQGGWGQGWVNWFAAQKIGSIRIGKWALNTFRRYITDQRRLFARRFPGVHPPDDPDALRAWTKQWMIDHPDPDDWPPLRLGATYEPRMPGRKPLALMDQKSATVPVGRLNPNVRHALKFLQFIAGEEYCQIINDGADALPGNRKYATIDRQINPDWPDERDIHRLTNEATKWGYVRQVSPFIDALVTERIINIQVQRLETDAQFTAAQAMQTAAKDLNDAIQRNLRDNPKLKQRYDAITKPLVQTTP